MEIKNYQRKAWRTINKDLSKNDMLANMVIGIAGESGEVSDIVKKHLYQGHELDKGLIEEELGDIMWYLANLCNMLDIEMEEVLEGNYEKLVKRYPKGFEEDKSINRE